MIKETQNQIFIDNKETKGFVGVSILENDVIEVMWENKESIIEIECEYTLTHKVTGKISLQ